MDSSTSAADVFSYATGSLAVIALFHKIVRSQLPTTKLVGLYELLDDIDETMTLALEEGALATASTNIVREKCKQLRLETSRIDYRIKRLTNIRRALASVVSLNREINKLTKECFDFRVQLIDIIEGSRSSCLPLELEPTIRLDSLETLMSTSESTLSTNSVIAVSSGTSRATLLHSRRRDRRHSDAGIYQSTYFRFTGPAVPQTPTTFTKDESYTPLPSVYFHTDSQVGVSVSENMDYIDVSRLKRKLRDGNVLRLFNQGTMKLFLSWPGYPPVIGKFLLDSTFNDMTSASIAAFVFRFLHRFFEQFSINGECAQNPLQENPWKIGFRHIRVHDLVLIAIHNTFYYEWRVELRLKRPIKDIIEINSTRDSHRHHRSDKNRYCPELYMPLIVEKYEKKVDD